ncbi:hypothetical protein HYT23_05110 [Candidatus Pacearchaeota archaeon]|nr:hypothetical protein [Candidatus Pacearchaeota archaeon]
MERENIKKKLRVIKKSADKIMYLKRVLPRTSGETRREGYELLGDMMLNYDYGSGSSIPFSKRDALNTYRESEMEFMLRKSYWNLVKQN